MKLLNAEALAVFFLLSLSAFPFVSAGVDSFPQPSEKERCPERASASDALPKIKIPIIHQIIVSDFPCTVSGGGHWLLNLSSGKWLLSIFNNEGVDRSVEKATIFSALQISKQLYTLRKNPRGFGS